MSVLVSDRTESKFEAITYSIELHDMLIDLMQRSFGVKDLDQLVRVRYAHGKDATEDFSRYRYLMLNYKNRIDQLASMLTSNVRAANSILPRYTKCSLYPVKNSISAQEIQSASCTKRRTAVWQVCPYISSSSCSTSSIRVAQLVAMRTTVWVSSYFSQKPNLALPSSAASCSLDNTMNT